jgi:hypothetical protein
MDDRAHQPTDEIAGRVLFVPEQDQRLLHGVPGEVVAAEDAARDVNEPRNVRLREIDACNGGAAVDRNSGARRERARALSRNGERGSHGNHPNP